MKIFKVLGKIVGGYIALDVMALAIIGCGTICKRVDSFPDDTLSEHAANICDDLRESFKALF